MCRYLSIIPILLLLPSLCFSTIAEYRYKNKNPQPKAIFPEITFEIQTASGSHSREEIKAVANSELISLRTLYYNYLNKGANFDGEILFKFTIDKNGKATKIDIGYSSTGNDEFDKAVKNKMADWKWNIKDNNTTATILFKFATLLPTYNDEFLYATRAYIVSGTRSLKDFVGMIHSRTPMLYGIRNRYFKQRPDLDNIVLIFKFEITGSGDVINVNVMVDTAEHAEFEEAVKSQVGHWKLKSIEVGNTAVTVLFNFRE